MAGTQWSFRGGSITAHFVTGGRTLMDLAGNAPHNQCSGAWAQTGNHLIFDCYGFAAFDMNIDGERMVGQIHTAASPASPAPIWFQKSPPRP